MKDKIKEYSLSAQGVSENTYVNFLKTAYESVNKGVQNSVEEFNRDPLQFDYRSAKAVFLNSSIKKNFQREAFQDNNLRNKIRHLKSHGMDYYVLEGKAIICFKKMDKKSRVSGFYSKRFQDLMRGEAVSYSQKMLENLSEMGIHKPLPIYFVGHVLDATHRVKDVRLVHYNNSEAAYVVSLAEQFRPNLFNLSHVDKGDEEIVVKSKNNKRKKAQ